jgi:hypothetical protein
MLTTFPDTLPPELKFLSCRGNKFDIPTIEKIMDFYKTKNIAEMKTDGVDFLRMRAEKVPLEETLQYYSNMISDIIRSVERSETQKLGSIKPKVETPASMVFSNQGLNSNITGYLGGKKKSHRKKRRTNKRSKKTHKKKMKSSRRRQK